LDPGNPSLFGRYIYDLSIGREDRIARSVEQKGDWIERRKTKVYVETNHAFLKSFYRKALQRWPDLRFIHLLRNPLNTARSEANREMAIERWHLPFCHYRADDGRRRFSWSLSGLETIFHAYDVSKLSLFQRYVVQWVEIQNRAMWVLDAAGARDRCFTLDSPADLNDTNRIRALFDFFGLRTKDKEIIVPKNYKKISGINPTIGYKTRVNQRDHEEFSEVIDRMPRKYLEIFQKEPYISFPWVGVLQR
jgi:hypothetical protein